MSDNTGAGSGNSGGTMSVMSKTTGGGKKKRSEAEVSDRKKIKALKQAVKDERAAKATIAEELEVVKERNLELTQEYETQSNKYLALYEENDKLQELLNTMQFKIQAAEKDGSLVSDLAAEMSSKFDFLKKGLRTGDSVDRQQREMQAVHDGELQQIQMTLKKV